MQYKIIVDKQPSTNPSDEKKEYIIDIEELRVKGDAYDSLNIELNRTYVTRRLSLSEYGVLSVLDEPVIEELTDVDIKLFEGDNYIYLMDMQGNKFYAEYLIKNDFNNIYANKNEMNSAITQTAESIELSVNQKLTSYATTDDLEEQVTELNSTVTQTAQEINLEVSKKVGDDEIISCINQSAEEIQINADKINIDGKAVNFTTEINEAIGPFTSEDRTKAMNYIVGNVSLTPEEIEKYDINNNGRVDSGDTVYMSRAIANGGNLSFNGYYKIDPYSKDKSISIYDKEGNYSAIISLINNYFDNLRVGVLETDYDNNKIRSQVGSDTISIVQANTSNSIFMNVGDWYDNTSSSGLQIMSGTSSQNGRIDIVAQQTNSFINLAARSNSTEISASGITTPKLTQTSLESIKKNITKFTKNATDIINNSDIYEYNLKSDEDTDKKMLGFVIGDKYRTPAEVIEKNGQAVELYSAIGILWKAVQELSARVEQLEKEVQHE